MPAAASARPLGVAIAGLGFGEKVHLPALRSCPHTQPLALWHPRAERLEAACGASGPAAMGKVIAWLKPHLAGRADMAAVSAQVKARLAG